VQNSKFVRLALLITLSLATLLLFCAVGAAQSTQVKGVSNGRSGATMSLQTGSGNLTVVLTDSTQVEDVAGIFHARRKDMGLTALVPGLAVQVLGSYNAQNQLVADTVRFDGSSLKTATDIQAGITPVEQQEQAQQQQINQQQAQLRQEQQEQAADAAKIAANKAALQAEIAAVNKRFGELADYNIWDEVTVYFGNGQVTVAPEYQPKLLALCQKAKTVTGYVIQVKGYASAVGSAALNPKTQPGAGCQCSRYSGAAGGIPLTNMLAPGDMSTSRQVASDATAEGQAENRRVVRVLQNKGIAGN
jgi:outer membrane protein OmpA-like peptidoglycan-associated protein